MKMLKKSPSKIYHTWRKNWPTLKGIFLNSYPSFVTRNTDHLTQEIPVFTFHDIIEDVFAHQLEFLSQNGYNTIDCDTLWEMIIGNNEIPPKTVLLSFDDGYQSLYTTAFPLLKKHHLKAVAFICPGLLTEEKVTTSSDEHPHITWNEARQMQKDGVIDFQSHTMYHDMVFTSFNLLDFIHPKKELFFENTHIPLFRNPLNQSLPLSHREGGFPLFKASMKMNGKQKIIIDPELVKLCREIIKNNGDDTFFYKHDWFNLLYSPVKNYLQNNKRSLSFEPLAKTKEDIYSDLLKSKTIIEKKLTKHVSHLAYPLYVGSTLSVKASQKAGYKTNFWGVLWGKKTNRNDKKPYHITRLSDFYIYRLPGVGRKPLMHIMKEHGKKNVGKFLKRNNFS
ncbi:polysaccharide deacetylase family protein [Chlamydiota bacterium]